MKATLAIQPAPPLQRRQPKESPREDGRICTHCGTANRGQRALSGSGWIELVLWLFWLLPGLIYSIWRRTGTKTCHACGRRDLVGLQTPAGRKLVREYHPDGLPPAPPPPPPPTTVRRLAWLIGGPVLLFLPAVLLLDVF